MGGRLVTQGRRSPHGSRSALQASTLSLTPDGSIQQSGEYLALSLNYLLVFVSFNDCVCSSEHTASTGKLSGEQLILRTRNEVVMA
jgi:hypothetical protein